MPAVHRLLLLMLVGAALVGCKTQPAQVHPKFGSLVHSGYRVAVLPMVNETNHVAAAVMCQMLMTRQLHKGFVARPFEQMQSFMKAKGVEVGGQLGAFAGTQFMFRKDLSPQILCKELGVEGLFVGKLTTFDYLEAGYGRKRQVNVVWMLVHNDGTTLWINEGAGFTLDFDKDWKRARKKMAASLAVRVIQDLAGMPMFPEAQAATRDCLHGLPAAWR